MAAQTQQCQWRRRSGPRACTQRGCRDRLGELAPGLRASSGRLWARAWLPNKRMGPQPSHEQTPVGRSRAERCRPLGQVSGGAATALTSLLQQLQTVTCAAKGLTVETWRGRPSSSLPLGSAVARSATRSRKRPRPRSPGTHRPTRHHRVTELYVAPCSSTEAEAAVGGKWKEPSHSRTRHGGLRQGVTPKQPAPSPHQASASPREEAAVGIVAVAELGGPNQKGRKEKTT